MTILPYVVDATADNFARVVLENSRRGPVLVNFWSPQAGPCMVLMPRLVRVLAEYGGRILGVMLDVDAYPRLAREFDVHALPMMQIFRDGAVVGRLQGVEPESGLRAFMSRHAQTPDSADQAYLRGDVARAAALAAAAALDHPEDPAAALRVAKLLVLDQRPEEALALLDAVPPAARSAEMTVLHAHLSLITAALQADPGAVANKLAASPDAETLFAAAAVAVQADDYAAACAHLATLMAVAPDFRGGLARYCVDALASLPQVPDDVRTQLQAIRARSRQDG